MRNVLLKSLIIAEDEKMKNRQELIWFWNDLVALIPPLLY
jgi:hypothetical protein